MKQVFSNTKQAARDYDSGEKGNNKVDPTITPVFCLKAL